MRKLTQNSPASNWVYETCSH